MAALNPQALIWFAVAGAAGAFGVSLLWSRFVRRDPRAVASGGGYALFASCMVLFAVGALVAGLASSGAGR